MWSHYAQKHEGICLGFNLTPIIGQFIMSVRYVKTLEPIPYWKFKDKALPLWLFTKSHVWKYEDEIRSLFLDMHGLINFDKRALKEIHYGLKTSDNQISKLESLLNIKDYNQIDSYKLAINQSTYDIKRARL